MLRWIRNKCKRHIQRRSKKHNRAEMSCHEGIDFHIYEEVPPLPPPKAELAYSIVSLVDQMYAKHERKTTSQYRTTPSSMSEIICTLCEKPLPGIMDIPESATCRCSGLSSFRSSDCSSDDKFSWLDYNCDEEHDLRRRHADMDSMRNQIEPEPRSRQPIYMSIYPDELCERRLSSDDSGGFFDTDNSGQSTDSSLNDSIVNNLDSLDLADYNDSMMSFGLSHTPRMGCRVIRRTRSAYESLGSSTQRVCISRHPSDFITPVKISKPVPVCGIHRSTEKSTLLRTSLKRRIILPENKAGQYASIRTGLQSYGLKESDMGFEPISTDDEDVCINVEYILLPKPKKSRGKKCLINQFTVAESSDCSVNDLDRHDHEFFV